MHCCPCVIFFFVMFRFPLCDALVSSCHFRPAVCDTLLPLCPLFLLSLWFFFLCVTIDIFICGFSYLFCLSTASLYIYITRTCSLQPLSLSHALFSLALFPSLSHSFALSSPSLSLFCSLSHVDSFLSHSTFIVSVYCH